jgi:hypothetical protein
MMWKWLICKPAGRTVLFLIGFLVSIAFQIFGFEFLILSNALYTPILYVLRTIILWIFWLGPVVIFVRYIQVLYISTNAGKSLLGICDWLGWMLVVGFSVLVYSGFLSFFGSFLRHENDLMHQYETSDHKVVSVYEYDILADSNECRIRVTSRMILPGLLIKAAPSEEECAYEPGSFKKITLPNDPQK